MEAKTFDTVVVTEHALKFHVRPLDQPILPAKIGDWLYMVTVDTKPTGTEYLLAKVKASLDGEVEQLKWVEDD